jgi:hypothetical protein
MFEVFSRSWQSNEELTEQCCMLNVAWVLSLQLELCLLSQLLCSQVLCYCRYSVEWPVKLCKNEFRSRRMTSNVFINSSFVALLIVSCTMKLWEICIWNLWPVWTTVNAVKLQWHYKILCGEQSLISECNTRVDMTIASATTLYPLQLHSFFGNFHEANAFIQMVNKSSEFYENWKLMTVISFPDISFLLSSMSVNLCL